MVTCPRCKEILRVEVEKNYTQTIKFEYKKKGRGIKMKNSQKHIDEVDLRIYFKCEECSYSTDNLNSIEGDDTELLHCKDEVDFIINQIYDMC